MWFYINNYILPLLILVFSGCVAWSYTDPEKFNKFEIPRRFRKVKHFLILYSRYLYSGGIFRRVLFTIVILSLALVLFFDLNNNKFIENMAFSVIAAFIFDAFLNFQKEHLLKCMVSRFWHSSYYSCYQRERAINSLFLDGKSLPYPLPLELLYTLIYKCLFNEYHFFITKEHSLPWSSDGNGMKFLNLPKGHDIRETVIFFIKEDAKFINTFYLDEKVTTSFPGLNEVSRRLNNSCLRALSMIETKLGLYQGWSGDDEMIIDQIKRYLIDRREFMKKCEKNLGHYGITGI